MLATILFLNLDMGVSVLTSGATFATATLVCAGPGEKMSSTGRRRPYKHSRELFLRSGNIKRGTRTLGQLNPLNPLNPLVCAGDKALPRPSPERQQELVTEEVGGIARMRLPNGPYGPVAISGLPRFAGIATFARLPQLHEIQTLQASSEAVLLLRLVNAGAVEPNAEIRLGERTHPLCEIQGEVSLPVLPEDGSLKVDMAGKRFQALALWTLPQNSWHRHVFVDQDNADNALEVDVKLKKHFRKFDIALVGGAV